MTLWVCRLLSPAGLWLLRLLSHPESATQRKQQGQQQQVHICLSIDSTPSLSASSILFSRLTSSQRRICQRTRVSARVTCTSILATNSLCKMEQRWRLALHLTCVTGPHAVDPSDCLEEIEDKAIPDEVGPSGGAGGSGGSVAAASFTNAVWFHLESGTIMADVKCAILQVISEAQCHEREQQCKCCMNL